MTDLQKEIMEMIGRILSEEGNETLTPIKAVYRALDLFDPRGYKKRGILTNGDIHQSLRNYMKRNK